MSLPARPARLGRRALLLLFAVAGCTSADPAYYTLRPVPGTVVPGPANSVKLARPGLAGYLDRPEIVRDGTSNKLLLLSGERWGEPLGDMIGRILAEDLTQRLPGSTVFTEAGAISVDADYTVEMDIQRFDLDPSGQVVLLSQVAVHSGHNRTSSTSRSIRVTMAPAGPGTAELVSAMSALVGQMADAVAIMLRGTALANGRS